MTELEKQVINTAKKVIGEALSKSLTQYSGPLHEIAEQVVSENYEDLKSMMNTSLSGLISDKDFIKMIDEEFKRKVAKNLVGELSGSIAQAANTFRQNPLLKNKMINAIQELINLED